MALYEKMVLISEQEYLQLKGFQMHVGERHDGDIDYGAGDDGGGGDDGDGGDGGGDDGGGDEGGAEQRRRLNEQYRAMFQRAWEQRNVNEPPPPQRLNEQYADFRHRMRQHLLRYRQDKRVAALPPRTPLPAASPSSIQLSPGQAAVATLHRLTPSQTAAATRQGLLHPTVFQPLTVRQYITRRRSLAVRQFARRRPLVAHHQNMAHFTHQSASNQFPPVIAPLCRRQSTISLELQHMEGLHDVYSLRLTLQ